MPSSQHSGQAQPSRPLLSGEQDSQAQTQTQISKPTDATTLPPVQADAKRNTIESNNNNNTITAGDICAKADKSNESLMSERKPTDLKSPDDPQVSALAASNRTHQSRPQHPQQPQHQQRPQHPQPSDELEPSAAGQSPVLMTSEGSRVPSADGRPRTPADCAHSPPPTDAQLVSLESRAQVTVSGQPSDSPGAKSFAPTSKQPQQAATLITSANANTANQPQRKQPANAPNAPNSAPQESLKFGQQVDFCKQRRLSYLQSLLLRKWPFLALAICIMSSLLFGMLLSVLTVFLVHSAGDCSTLALANRRPASHAHEHLARPSDFDTPIEAAALADDLFARVQHHHEHHQMQQQQSAPQNASQQPQFQRLPSALWPIHYDLFVQPYIAEPFNFTGKVTIRIKCTEATDSISLHAHELQIEPKSIALVPASDQQSPAPKVVGLSTNKQLQYAIVQLDGKLERQQEYLLTLEFVGSLNDDLAGFYKIKYDSAASNETTWIAATRFQATDARRAFPCFDEPLFKATFSIQIKHWTNMTALSNMPIVERQPSADGLWVTDTFAKSHRMSTYLVAYAVTNFESRSEGNISVWTRPGFVHTAEYALKIAGKILRHYEDFFGVEYPLPKMDMIALPDFNAGAMENWGLITYRETAMLYDETSSSVSNKQRVAVVVAHELAHQWFGNLVTPKWWDDLWLNEGFASYVEYIGVNFVEPKWRMLDQFVVEEVQNVFKVDGLSSSHQISQPVNNPDEISEIFDHISYAKGASIIRMMNYFLTEDVFKAGLRGYLSALRYSNAEQSDLWRHLTEAQRLAGATNNATSTRSEQVNVERVMNSWTLQTGYPLVTLTREYGNKRRATLDQVRYQPYKTQRATDANASTTSQTLAGSNSSSSAAANLSSADLQRWEIPITFTSKAELDWQPRTRLWMHQNVSTPLQLDESQVPPRDDQWMLLNVGQVGYYRVNYDLRNWEMLINQLLNNHSLIITTNRAQILDDVFELARSAQLDYRFAMEATRYLYFERDYLPWDTVLMSFTYLDDMLQRTPIYGDWRDYIANLIAPYYARYKDTDWTLTSKQSPQANSSTLDATPAKAMDTDDVLEQYNQVNAIAWACQVNSHCIGKAKATFSEWRSSGKNNINPALRYTVYCSAIESGNKDDWDFLWRAYEKEQNASERDRILRALGCSKEMWILSRYLEWTFNKSKPIRRQDGSYVFRTIARNNYGRDLAFNFMRERWPTIREFYGKTSFALGTLIRSVSASMNTQVELNQLIAFYDTIKSDVGTGKRSFQIAIEEAETNIRWRERNYKILEDWLKKK